MKKTKILVALTTVAVLAVAALGLTACKKQTDNKNAEIYAIYTEYVAYAESNGEKPLSYEEWLSTIKGEKGDKGDKGEKGENGKDGEKGEKGEDGKDGHTPIITIGENGNWFIDGVDTTVKAQGEKGEQGERGNDGVDGKDGEQGEKGEDGKDGHTPIITIGENGNWFIDGVDTTVKAQGEQGEKGEQGNDGVDGEQGERGVGIEKVEYDKDGNLVIYFTDGTQQTVKAPEKHEHTFGEWTAFTAEDTFCENRLFYRECTECNSVEWKRGSYSDHKWNVVTTAPTCQSRGYDTKTCSICGKVEVENYTDIIDHAWKSEYSYDNSYHWLECTTCDEIKDKEEHTVESSGECSVCHALVGATEGVLYDIADGKASVIGYEGTAMRVRIADTYNGAHVTEICNSAFKNKNIESVVIPEGVTTIGINAFNRSSLMSVYITNLTAWCKISGLDNIMSGKKELYLNYKPITQLIIPNDVTTIGSSAFSGCSSLTSVKIPSSVTTIGYQAFYDCSGLKSIEIPSSVTTIGYQAFYDCSGLKSIEIPNVVTEIGWEAFSGCSSLTSVELPNSLTTIESSAFSGCDNLEFKQYGNAKYLGNKDNEYFALIEVANRNYSTYTIHENTKVIAVEAFSGCTRLTEIDIPKGVLSINSYAFSYCDNLTSIIIPDSVTYIGNATFRHCVALKTIKIPKSIETIKSATFNECESLEKVYYGGTKEEWKNIAVETYNGTLGSVIKYFYSKTQPADTDDKYWHFVDGEIVEW